MTSPKICSHLDPSLRRIRQRRVKLARRLSSFGNQSVGDDNKLLSCLTFGAGLRCEPGYSCTCAPLLELGEDDEVEW